MPVPHGLQEVAQEALGLESALEKIGPAPSLVHYLIIFFCRFVFLFTKKQISQESRTLWFAFCGTRFCGWVAAFFLCLWFGGAVYNTEKKK